MLCPLSALSLCPRCVACEYAFISHFKGVFSGFCGVCVGLSWSCALRGLCGFCVREWLGGLKGCGVFASIFVLLLLFFFFFACFPALLVLFAGFVYLYCLCGSLGCVVGSSFSLSVYTQKKGRKFFASSLVLLWACLDVLKHYCYLLRFVVPMSSPFTGNSCNLFRMLRCVFSFLPVFIYH